MSLIISRIATAAGLLFSLQAVAAAPTAALAPAAAPATTYPLNARNALEVDHLGLYPAAGFRQATGNCTDCAASRQSLWYFRDDIVAVPANPRSGLPSPVWLGSSLQVDGARILADGSVRSAEGATAPLHLTARLASNRAWWDAKTTGFFAQRDVRLRGSATEDGKFVARTVWPRDFVLTGADTNPLQPSETLTTLARQMGGNYQTRVLWQRHPNERWAGKAAIGIMLNGAQGDDDEAHGGHFAIATGIVGKGGEWSDWLVNNFYNLDSVSEKGIVAARVPMDNYLMDINSGQQFYRPSGMLVAVLKDGRTASAFQSRIDAVFERFYRHEFTYRHAAANCAGISIDAFRELGWNVPTRGATGPLKAIGAYAYLAATEMSLSSGRAIYDYLTEEQTRLYPAVAFDALGSDLMGLVGAGRQVGARRVLTDFERQLQNDVEALVWVQIPQVPSTRAAGMPPVFSFDEFMQRAPSDRANWQIVPVPPRPFPAELRDPGSAVPADPSPVPMPVAGVAATGVFGAGLFWRRRRRRGS